jgi:microcystin-dependent protein
VEEAMPIGAIIAYGGNGIPAGWLLCDGQPIPEKHKDLREKIGMNTPNLKRKFIVGADPEKLESDTFDYISGSKGGEEKHQLTEDEMPSHSHTINDPGHNHAPDGTYSYLVSIGGKNTSTEFDDKTGDHNNEIDLINAKAIKTSTTGITINNSGGGVSHNNMPPYYALTYIIKC